MGGRPVRRQRGGGDRRGLGQPGRPGRARAARAHPPPDADRPRREEPALRRRNRRPSRRHAFASARHPLRGIGPRPPSRGTRPVQPHDRGIRGAPVAIARRPAGSILRRHAMKTRAMKTRNAWLFSTALAALAIAAPATPAAAQDDQPPVATEASENGDEAIVVTARRREESLLNVPIAISAYSGEQLANQGAIDITDITNTTPNVNLEVS